MNKLHVNCEQYGDTVTSGLLKVIELLKDDSLDKNDINDIIKVLEAIVARRS